MDRTAEPPFEPDRLTGTGKYVLSLLSLFFGLIPTRVFIGISSDILIISSTLIPITGAVLIIIATQDLSFGLPSDKNIQERFISRRNAMQTSLRYIIISNATLLMSTLLAKAMCLWLSDDIWYLFVACHFFAFLVGGQVVICILQLRRIFDIVGYMGIGADFAMMFRNTLK